MNNILIKGMLTITSTLLINSSVFATTLNSNISCPSAAEIAAHADFVQAEIIPPGPNTWGLYSSPFTHDNKTWYVMFGVQLPNATSLAEALAQGKEIFKSKVELSSPQRWDKNIPLCFYASFDKAKQDKYLVTACTESFTNTGLLSRKK